MEMSLEKLGIKTDQGVPPFNKLSVDSMSEAVLGYKNLAFIKSII
jgi:hypothetical protein